MKIRFTLCFLLALGMTGNGFANDTCGKIVVEEPNIVLSKYGLPENHCTFDISKKACKDVYKSEYNVLENTDLLSHNQLQPSFKGFVVSIDKSSFAKFEIKKTDKSASTNFQIGDKTDTIIDFASAENLTSKRLKKRINKTFLKQKKNMFVTGIKAFNIDSKLDYAMTRDCVGKSFNTSQTFIDCSLSSLDALEVAIQQELESPTQQVSYSHVIVHSTGWHTRQKASILHYNQIFSSLALETDNAFNPLYVTLTWPSDWRIKIISYFNKANDADEIGLTWANYLINHSIASAIENAEIQIKPKYVALSHSFGARLIGTAVNSRGFIRNPVETKVDTLVLIQPAFSATRFYTDPNKDHLAHFKYFEAIDDHVDSIIITSSRADKANSVAFWSGLPAGHIGTGKTHKKICERVAKENKTYWADRFICRQQTAPDFGNWAPLLKEPQPILYLRLDSKIEKQNYNHCDNIIDDHNDVKRRPFAKVLAELIR